MKKSLLIGLSAALSFSWRIAAAQQTNTELLAQTLSLGYGAPVEIEISEQNCQIIYPEVQIKEFVYDENSQTSELKKNEQQQALEQKVVATLAKTTASCVKVADFKDMAQYQVINTEPRKLLAQIYNLSTLPFVKDIDIKTFNETMQIVPQIGLVSGYKLNIANASYTQIDETTGLKKEMGNLADLSVNTSITPEAQTVKYLTDTQLKGLNLSLPMVSMRIGSEHQVTEITYNTADENFDYANLLKNFMALESSRSRVIAKDIKIGSDLFDAGLSFDMEVKSRAERTAAGNMDSFGDMMIDNIAFTGDFLEKSKQPQSISINAQFNNIAMSDFAKLNEIQMKALETESENAEIDERELVAVLDGILDKAVFVEDVAIKFSAADIKAHFELYRRNKYLQGQGELTVNNFYNIFPELKICQSNPLTTECVQNPMYNELKNYLDLQKDHSVNVFEFTENGIFLNKKRIADPIEIDLQKIMENSSLDDDIHAELATDKNDFSDTEISEEITAE